MKTQNTQNTLSPSTKLSVDEKRILAPILRLHFDTNKYVTFTSFQLAQKLEDITLMKVTFRQVIRLVNYLRQLGIPITSNSKGYTYTEDKEEIMATVISLRSRIEALKETERSLLTTLSELLEEAESAKKEKALF